MSIIYTNNTPFIGALNKVEKYTVLINDAEYAEGLFDTEAQAQDDLIRRVRIDDSDANDYTREEILYEMDSSYRVVKIEVFVPKSE